MNSVDRSRRPVTTGRTRNAALVRSVAVSAALLSVAIAGTSRSARADAEIGSATAATAPGAALLIGNGKPAALPALPGCEPALHSLGDRLRSQGDVVTEIADAPGPALRAAIGSFAGRLPSSGRVLVAYCGYAMADSDKLFLLPADASITGAADLPRHAIIARTVSRILSAHSSMFVAELHAPPSANTGATSLQSAIQSLREETAPGTRLSIEVDPTTAGAPLIEAFTSHVSASKDWTDIPAAGASAPSGVAAPDDKSGATSVKADNPTAGGDKPADAEPADPQATSAATAVPPVQGSSAPARTDTDATDSGSAVPPVSPSASSPINLVPVRKAPKPVVAATPDAADTGSETVRRIQSALARRGLMKGAITGHDDQDTQKAVSAYQSTLNHPATGFLTYPEMNALESKFITSTLPAQPQPPAPPANAGDNQ